MNWRTPQMRKAGAFYMAFGILLAVLNGSLLLVLVCFAGLTYVTHYWKEP